MQGQDTFQGKLALRPMAGQRTLDPLMVVRIHQGQLKLGICGPICWSKFHLLRGKVTGMDFKVVLVPLAIAILGIKETHTLAS